MPILTLPGDPNWDFGQSEIGGYTHASVRITEKHYNPWNRARQAQAEADVQRAWERDPMVALEEKFQQLGHISGTGL